MKKIELLFNELAKMKNKNSVKFVIIEIVIIFLAFGSFMTNMSSQFKMIIFMVLLVVSLIYLTINLVKHNTIAYCRDNYQNHPNNVLDKLEKRNAYFLNMFDFMNETLIFKEIIRTLKTLHKYPDNGLIGPWEIIYNQRKTKKFYDNLKLKDISSKEKFELYPKELIDLLLSLGIEHEKIYDVWQKKIGRNKTYEIMYPIYGLILNDSQVLSHGLLFKEYKLNNTYTLKPYETQLAGDDVIMLHIKALI